MLLLQLLKERNFRSAFALLSEQPCLIPTVIPETGRLPLHDFCLAKTNTDVGLAVALLLLYPDAVYHTDNEGYLPIHMCAQAGSVDLFERFVALYHESVTRQAVNGRSCIHFAAQEGHSALVEKILRIHPQQAMCLTSEGRLPLHLAAYGGNMKCVKMLVSAFPDGVALTIKELGYFPLLIAAEFRHCEVSTFLLACKPMMLFAVDCFGRNPVEMAILHRCTQVLRIFLEYDGEGCVSFVHPHSGRNVFHHACLAGCDIATVTLLLQSSQPSSREILLPAPSPAAIAAVKRADVWGYLPLHVAAQQGAIAVFKALLQLYPEGACARALNGRTPLHFASQEGHTDVVRLLVSVMSPHDLLAVANDDGSSALHLAAYGGHTEVVEAIVAAELSCLHLMNADGWLPLHSCVHGARPFNERVIRILMQAQRRRSEVLFTQQDKIGVDIFAVLVKRLQTICASDLSRCLWSVPELSMLPDSPVITESCSFSETVAPATAIRVLRIALSLEVAAASLRRVGWPLTDHLRYFLGLTRSLHWHERRLALLASIVATRMEQRDVRRPHILARLLYVGMQDVWRYIIIFL